jgi:hypothetical protein
VSIQETLAPRATKSNRKLPPIAHLADPAREHRSLCGRSLKRNPAPGTNPCVVCLTMANYGRFAGR